MAHQSTANGEPFPPKWRPSRFIDERTFEDWFDEIKHRRIVRNTLSVATDAVDDGQNMDAKVAPETEDFGASLETSEDLWRPLEASRDLSI